MKDRIMENSFVDPIYEYQFPGNPIYKYQEDKVFQNYVRV